MQVEVRWKSQRWHVLVAGQTVGIHNVRDEAVAAARSRAQALGGQMVVYRKDGSPDPFAT